MNFEINVKNCMLLSEMNMTFVLKSTIQKFITPDGALLFQKLLNILHLKNSFGKMRTGHYPMRIRKPQSPTIISECKSISSLKAFFLFCVDKFFISFIIDHIYHHNSVHCLTFDSYHISHVCLLTSYANVECQMSRYLHKKILFLYHCCERQKHIFSHAFCLTKLCVLIFF